jgi:hypothetical protein
VFVQTCPKCGHQLSVPFNSPCPSCGLWIEHLIGLTGNSFQRARWSDHTTLITGNNVNLGTKDYNASFNYIGVGNIDDLVKFTMLFGHDATLTNGRGIATLYRVAYLTEIVGSGSSIYFPGLAPCSGVCVISPNSEDYGHTYPILSGWVASRFGHVFGTCRICGCQTPFAIIICSACSSGLNFDWNKMLYPLP